MREDDSDTALFDLQEAIHLGWTLTISGKSGRYLIQANKGKLSCWSVGMTMERAIIGLRERLGLRLRLCEFDHGNEEL